MDLERRQSIACSCTHLLGAACAAGYIKRYALIVENPEGNIIFINLWKMRGSKIHIPVVAALYQICPVIAGLLHSLLISLPA